MTTSYNGWPASPNPKALHAVTYEVPNVPNRKWTTVEVAAPLFKYLIRRFDAEVDRVPGGTYDDWSYAYRMARYSTSLVSCHASATAVDIDASQFPMGTTHMSPAQEKAVHRILSACRDQFRWGGDFQSAAAKDQMHFELAKGTSPETVRRAIIAMFLHPDGRQLHVADLTKDADPRRIVLQKKALAAAGLYPKRPIYNGRWNPRLTTAWNTWFVARPKEAKQKRIDTLGTKTRLY